MRKLQAKIGIHPLSFIYVRGNLKIEKNKKIRFKRELPFSSLRATSWEEAWIEGINSKGIVFLSLI